MYEQHIVTHEDVEMHSPLLEGGTAQSCLFRHKNAEIRVRIGNRSSCVYVWDGGRFSIISLRYNYRESKLAWGSVQSCVRVFSCNSAKFVVGVVNGCVFPVFYKVTMQNSLLGEGRI